MSQEGTLLLPTRSWASRFGDAKLSLFAYALVAPLVLLILGLVGYPFVYAIYVSFTDQVVGNVGRWIGFANFEYLFRSATFNSAVWNTIVIVLVSDVLKLLIGLGLALLVHQNLPARGIFRSLLMLPWAIPAFVAFLAWRGDR